MGDWKESDVCLSEWGIGRRAMCECACVVVVVEVVVVGCQLRCVDPVSQIICLNYVQPKNRT